MTLLVFAVGVLVGAAAATFYAGRRVRAEGRLARELLATKMTLAAVSESAHAALVTLQEFDEEKAGEYAREMNDAYDGLREERQWTT